MKYVFVIIRYSILTSDGSSWVLGKKYKDTYKDKLFNPERMRSREFFFKNNTVASLCELEKKLPNDVVLKTIVVTSNELPKENKENLEKVCALLSNPVIKFMDKSYNYVKFMEDIVKDEVFRKRDAGLYATVRLDDDDCLSYDFAINLRKYMEPSFKGFCVSFPQGYRSYYDKNYKLEGFKSYKKPLLAQGLSYIDGYNIKDKEKRIKTVYSLGNHTKVDQKSPVIIDSTFSAYVWAVHEYSDLSISKERDKQAIEFCEDDVVAKSFPHVKINSLGK